MMLPATVTQQRGSPGSFYCHGHPERPATERAYACRIGPKKGRRALLDAENLSEPEDAYRHAREMLAAKAIALPYRTIVVDEAQDLGAEAFRLISALAPSVDGKPS